MHLIEMDRSTSFKRKRHMSENSAVALLESVLTPPKAKRSKTDDKTPTKDAKNICIDRQLHMDSDLSPKFTAKSFYGAHRPLHTSPREASSFPVSVHYQENRNNNVADVPVTSARMNLDSKISPNALKTKMCTKMCNKTPKMTRSNKPKTKSYSATKPKSNNKRKFGKLSWVENRKLNHGLIPAKPVSMSKDNGSSKSHLTSKTTQKPSSSPPKQGYVFNFSSPQWPKPRIDAENKPESVVNAFNEFDFEHHLWPVEPKEVVKKFFKKIENGNTSLGTPSNVVLKIGFQGKIVAHREPASGSDKSSLPTSASKKKMFPFPGKKLLPHARERKVKDIASDPMLRKLREELLDEKDENASFHSSVQQLNTDLVVSATASAEHSCAIVRDPLSDNQSKLNSNLSSNNEQYRFGVDSENKSVAKTALLDVLNPDIKPDSLTAIQNNAILSKIDKNNTMSANECSVNSLPSGNVSRKQMPAGASSVWPIVIDHACSELGGSEELFSQSSFVASERDPVDVSDTESNESGPTTRRRAKSMQSTTGAGTPGKTSPQSTPKQSTLAKYFKTSGSPILRVAKISPCPRRRLSSCLPKLQKENKKDAKEQYILDAGQKRFGAIQCEDCGMVYSVGDVTDETMHAKHHHELLTTLKFPGWKKERVVQEYDDVGSRVILVLSDDPKYTLKKVDDMSRVMARDLGFPPEDAVLSSSSKVFLYISDDKRIEGCCVGEAISKGYRVIPDTEQPDSGLCNPIRRHRPWCCQTEPEPTTVGICRIWVCSQSRRKRIATRLLDCLRHWFSYGTVIDKAQIAFSDPTPDGRQLAAAYTGTTTFLVYKYKTNRK